MHNEENSWKSYAFGLSAFPAFRVVLKAPAGEVTSTSTEGMGKLVSASVGWSFFQKKMLRENRKNSNTNPNTEPGRNKDAHQQKQ